MTLGAVILSGGASRRMGRPKALLPFRGETVLDRLIGLYQEFCAPVIVVLGHTPDLIRQGIRRGGDVTFAVNPDPERGQLSSLQCGLQAVSSGAGVLFTPVDYPAVEKTTVDLLVRRFRVAQPPLLAPSYRGKHGHPVLIAGEVQAALLALPPTAMAREATSRFRERAEYVDVDDAAVCQDIDRAEDYERLMAAEAARE